VYILYILKIWYFFIIFITIYIYICWYIFTSFSSGAAILNNKQRLWIGDIILLVLSQHKINLKFAEYFSIVLRRACWASFDKWSASFKTTTITIINKFNYYKDDLIRCWKRRIIMIYFNHIEMHFKYAFINIIYI